MAGAKRGRLQEIFSFHQSRCSEAPAFEKYEAKKHQGHLRVRLYISPARSSLMIERAEIGVERVTGGIKVESQWADGRE